MSDPTSTAGGAGRSASDAAGGNDGLRAHSLPPRESGSKRQRPEDSGSGGGSSAADCAVSGPGSGSSELTLVYDGVSSVTCISEFRAAVFGASPGHTGT